MLRLLANENIPGIAIDALTMKGYDVAWIRRDSPGSSDEQVLERAEKEKRIIITFDKDFGELAFKRGLPASCGIILFRIPPLSPQYIVETVEKVFKSRNDWADQFSVIEMNKIRIRPMQSK